MDTRCKLGVVGFGRRGRSLFGASVASFGATAVAVCDIQQAHLHTAAETYPGVQCFASLDRMLEEASLDALLVETPATYHAECCAKALGRNIHVLSDVPAVASLEEADTLWRANEASHAIYMFGANPNMWGFVDAAVDLVSEGALGKPYYMEAEYIHDLRKLFDDTPWRETFECIRYCTHSLGPLLRLTDEDLEWVSCLDTGSHINGKEGQHDAMVAIFRSRSNLVVRLLVSFINNCPGYFHGYRVYGTKGYFERRPAREGAGPAATLYYSTEHHTEKALHEIEAGETPRGLEEASGGHGGADHALLQSFFNAIRTGAPSPIPLREGLRMTLPGIAAAQAARSGGQPVRIRYPWSTD